MTVWFTSDTHFAHRNVIEFCKRPFASIEEMDEEIIRRWNERVEPGDRVYHLGDFAFGDHDPYLSRLNGMKNLVIGNHDGGRWRKATLGIPASAWLKSRQTELGSFSATTPCGSGAIRIAERCTSTATRTARSNQTARRSMSALIAGISGRSASATSSIASRTHRRGRAPIITEIQHDKGRRPH